MDNKQLSQLEKKIARRAYKIDAQFTAIDEIRWMNIENKLNTNYKSQVYFEKSKQKVYQRLKQKYHLFDIDYQHQAINCAKEATIHFDKLKQDFLKSKLFSIDAIVNLYKIVRCYYK